MVRWNTLNILYGWSEVVLLGISSVYNFMFSSDNYRDAVSRLFDGELQNLFIAVGILKIYANFILS
jgi:hypothetical protein